MTEQEPTIDEMIAFVEKDLAVCARYAERVSISDQVRHLAAILRTLQAVKARQAAVAIMPGDIRRLAAEQDRTPADTLNNEGF